MVDRGKKLGFRIGLALDENAVAALAAAAAAADGVDENAVGFSNGLVEQSCDCDWSGCG